MLTFLTPFTMDHCSTNCDSTPWTGHSQKENPVSPAFVLPGLCAIEKWPKKQISCNWRPLYHSRPAPFFCGLVALNMCCSMASLYPKSTDLKLGEKIRWSFMSARKQQLLSIKQTCQHSHGQRPRSVQKKRYKNMQCVCALDLTFLKAKAKPLEAPRRWYLSVSTRFSGGTKWYVLLRSHSLVPLNFFNFLST